jgi:abortive infection bacteriophage resistance protein
MAKIAYPKQIKSFDDQKSILKSRGMVIKDEARKTDSSEHQLLSSQWLLVSTLG